MFFITSINSYQLPKNIKLNFNNKFIDYNHLDKENIKPLERGEFWICSGEKAKVYPIAYNAPVDLYQNYYCIESDFPEGF